MAGFGTCSSLYHSKYTTSTMKLYLLCALFGLAFATDEYIIGGNDVTVAGKYPWQVRFISI